MKITERPENFHFQGGEVALIEGGQKIFIFKGEGVALLREGVFFLGGDWYPSAYCSSGRGNPVTRGVFTQVEQATYINI